MVILAFAEVLDIKLDRETVSSGNELVIIGFGENLLHVGRGSRLF